MSGWRVKAGLTVPTHPVLRHLNSHVQSMVLQPPLSTESFDCMYYRVPV